MGRSRYLSAVAGLIVFAPAIHAASRVEAGPALPLDALIRGHRAIEEVYWSHRIWPAENRQPKPPLESVLPDEVIRNRVQDTLRKSSALETIWHRPIRGADLQAEIDRMAAGSRDPSRLRKIFAAVGHAPRLVAEVLARPALADRRIRALYAADPAFHMALRREAEAALAAHPSFRAAAQLGGDYREVFLEPGDAREAARRIAAIFRRGRAEEVPEATWSPLLEDADRFYVASVLEASPGRLRIATVSWWKTTFDEWWSSVGPSFPARAADQEVAYSLPEPRAGGCADDTWSVMDPEMPVGRTRAAAVWTGTEMIVWGGREGPLFDTGLSYNPATDTWSSISSAGAPSPRDQHFAFWTGTEMLVWGGRGPGDAPVEGGGRYSPATDSWTPISPSALADGRASTSAVWTGSGLIVWGGDGGTGLVNTGARYDPATDTWTPTSTASAPSGRFLHSAVWADSRMIVWGGQDDLGSTDTGGRYDPTSDSWLPTRSTGAPAGRERHTAVWSGSEMIVWGGTDGEAMLDSGGRYDPSSDRWFGMANSGSPAPRADHTAIWTGSEMIVWGGQDDILLLYFNSGARYDPSRNRWTGMTSSGAPTERIGQVAVWTGAEMIVWGGNDRSLGAFDDGGRYAPSTDSWTPTLDTANRPGGRSGFTSTWTGSEMIVWGGQGNSSAAEPLPRGSRYDPATDAWESIPTLDAPISRTGHTAVWTGTELIVWGGQNTDPTSGAVTFLADGGGYNPTTGAWTATSAVGAPTARSGHGSVWTGQAMLVWGGRGCNAYACNLDTGALYDPVADTWTPTTTVGAPSPRNLYLYVWTGREMMAWGGQDDSGSLGTGGRYDPLSDRWWPMAPGGLSARGADGVAIWTGKEMVVWGGFGPFYVPLNTGGRYDPLLDRWTSTSTLGVPALSQHSGVWTCDRMLVWGGYESAGTPVSNLGYAYDPASDVWAPLSSVGAPWARRSHGAVGTGTQMIIWSGYDGHGYTGTGGSYCACSTPTPLAVPALILEKGSHAERVKWGGVPYATTYDVVRGSLGVLRASGGDFSVATEICLAGETPLTWVDDATTAGAGLWYLVRARRLAEIGTYDNGSPRQVGSRDAEIAASGVACP